MADKRPPKKVRAQIRRYDDTIRSQVYLERFKTALVNDFENTILQVEADITYVLSRLKDENLGNLNRAELNTLLGRLRKIESDGYAAQLERLSGQLESLGGYSAKRETTQLNDWAARTASSAKFKQPALDEVWSLVQNQPIAATGDLLGGFLDTYKERSVARMEGAIRNGWAQGKTNGELIRQLRGTKAKNFKDGILRGKDRQAAEAVVRTSVQHTANTARLKTWENNKDIVQGYMWLSTLDGVTTTTCRSLDRKRFKLGQGPIPPIHVNCRSTTIADLGEKWDFLNEGATRSSANGYVPADKSYYEWLKTQDHDFVKDALGAKRAQLFLNGGLSPDEFARLNLGKNFEPLTLEDMKKKDAAAFKKAGL